MTLLEAEPSQISDSSSEDDSEAKKLITSVESLKLLVGIAKGRLMFNNNERGFEEFPKAPHVFEGFFGNGATRIRVSSIGFPGVNDRPYGLCIALQEKFAGSVVNTFEIQTAKDPTMIDAKETKRLAMIWHQMNQVTQTLKDAKDLSREDYNNYFLNQTDLKPNVPSLVANLAGSTASYISNRRV